ncbi:UNVERIFIED_CONTAM: hypothetical protein K2H54_044252 [Gekko kuhli]
MPFLTTSHVRSEFWSEKRWAVGVPYGADRLTEEVVQKELRSIIAVCVAETMENPKYELIIEAKDMGGMDVGLTGTATATIVVDDKNDHPPEFTKKEYEQVTVMQRVKHVQPMSGTKRTLSLE